jgi:hypothetical protein
MNQKIELRIKYTAEDYARGLRYIQQRSFLVKFIFFVPLMVIFVTLLVLFLKDPQNFINAFSRVEGFLPILLAIGILYPIIYYFRRNKTSFIVRKQYEKQIKSSPALQAERNVIFDDEGLTGNYDFGSGKISWNAFIEATETDDDFYFFTAKKQAQFVPKRVFEDEFQINLLRGLARVKLGERAKF